MRRTLTLAFAMALIGGAPVAAASHGQGPAVSASSAHQKPCGKTRRPGCQWIEINSFSFGAGRGPSAPTHGASDREGSTPSIGEVTVHKPKRKGH
jgi:hypothetical protein